MTSVPSTGPPNGRDDRGDPGEPTGPGPRHNDDLPAGVAMGPGGEFLVRAGPPAPFLVGAIERAGATGQPTGRADRWR
jgi:hypothetical protein